MTAKISVFHVNDRMPWLFYRWLVVFGISLCVLKDSQSLFLRHVQSGKCITAGGLVYETNGYALPYWAIMTENCLNVSAQFRYLDSELLHNIEKDGTFFPPASSASVYKKRLAVYKGIKPGGKATQNSDRNRLKQSANGTLYFYHKREKRCAETSQTDDFVNGVDSCGGNPEQNFTFGAVTEHNARMENVSCSKEQHMMIQTADYGNYDNSGTFDQNANIDTQCSKLTNCQVKSRCGGNRSCELTMHSNLLPSQYCSDTSKQIYIKYTCVDTYSSSAITTAPNIRLTSRNEGYIEVKDGSIWRRVVEENWDQNRQNMLCQHLGFEEINGKRAESKQLESVQEIATGDLICYNTQPNGTSCCVHLEPSTSTTNTRFPYVRCKICNNPLLGNANAFPDSVFSGSGDSGNKYEDARITKGGWCPSESGNTYLLLDLQKEYHIARVVVMADRAQTKWSGSYSLKYSRDTSYKNTEQISGNQNGYQASRTNLDIYNVRHVKIESTGNHGQNFCLRIELCGEVQTPAPVSNINVSPSQYSAHVTWQLFTSNQNSSYITKIIVYLNGEERTTISRGTEVTIDRLLPYTSYTVEIQTQDGSLQKSKNVTKTFETSKAEPANLVAISYSSLNASIGKPETFIKGVMIIVQIASTTPTSVKDIQTKELKPYQNNTQNPYITAYLNTDFLPLTFVIGDNKNYKFKNRSYHNHPLQQNSNYIVFLRFFTMDSFFSTDWSNSVMTPEQPPVPTISKILSTARKKYTISWIKPTLPVYQTVLMYYVNYRVVNGSNHSRSISKDKTSIIVDVKYEERYIFELQVVTEAGISEVALETWTSHSAPLEMPIERNDSYTIKLRKPKNELKIKNVTLVLLKSESKNPPAPEDVELQMSPSSEDENDVAFRAKVFDIAKFQEDTIEISLQQSTDKRRRKRNAVVVHALAPMSTYRAAQLNTDESGNELWSYWSEPFEFTGRKQNDKPDSDTSSNGGIEVGVAVGAAVAAVVIAVALILAVVYFRRRRNNKQDEDSETGLDEKRKKKTNVEEMNSFENDYHEGDAGYPNDAGNRDDVGNPNNSIANGNNENIYLNESGDVEEKVHLPVPIAEFSHYVNELKKNQNCEFQKQYEDLPKNMKTSWEVAKKPFNKKKNRYGNIVTYDYCRVVLSGDENQDYINASYIDGIKENSYIASQGPNKLTVDDMWRMVWEQRSYSVVMVTSLKELGKPKCEKYWPDKGTEMYGDIEVTLMKIEEFASHVSHTLKLKKDGEEREVRHYYFQSWPDHGVPKYPTQLLAFRRHFRTHHLEQSGPIIVHCSAGVGRTGVFLAIDTILYKFEKGVINSIDVFGEVCAMRERRMNMVQTLEQYIFIHDAILETILCGINEVDSSKIQEEIKQLAEIKASGMTGFQEKFKRLGEVSPKLSPEECSAALLEENQSKNRNKNIYPAESNRVPLPYVSGTENSDYINAVFVNGYLGRNYFIATQSPLPNTTNDFWRLVHLQQSSTIVLLNNVKNGTSFPKFWPTERGKPTQYDRLTVQLESEKESDGIWTRKFILSPYPDLSDGQVVNIFHYMKWPDHRAPPNATSVITLTSLVENSRKAHGHGPIIVACSDGAGRTGTYIAISNLLERMKIEQAVDVFRSIKIIRATRPQFVENAEQYQFCYTAVMAYLDAFSEYANFD